MCVPVIAGWRVVYVQLYQRQPPHLLLTILHLKQTHYLYNCLHHKLLDQITSLLRTQVTLEGKLRHLVYCYMNDNGGRGSNTIFVFNWLPYFLNLVFLCDIFLAGRRL